MTHQKTVLNIRKSQLIGSHVRMDSINLKQFEVSFVSCSATVGIMMMLHHQHINYYSFAIADRFLNCKFSSCSSVMDTDSRKKLINLSNVFFKRYWKPEIIETFLFSEDWSWKTFAILRDIWSGKHNVVSFIGFEYRMASYIICNQKVICCNVKLVLRKFHWLSSIVFILMYIPFVLLW